MAKCRCNDVELRMTFELFDKDHNGFIDKLELRDAVKAALKDEQLKDPEIDAITNSVMASIDKSGDGNISYEEFKKGFSV